MIRPRTVFLIAAPFEHWREPIAELTPGENGLVAVRSLETRLDPDRYELHKPLAALAKLLLEDLVETTNEELTAGRRLPSLGPSAVLGDLVRVKYADGTVEDLDECSLVACHPGSTYLPLETFTRRLPDVVSYRLMSRSPDSGAGESVYFDDGPRALPLVPVAKARGCAALIESSDGGPAWDRVTVESWEDEARRLRHQAGHLAHGMRRWAKNDRDLATQPPSAEEAATHESEKRGSANALDMAAGKIERSLAPAIRRVKGSS